MLCQVCLFAQQIIFVIYLVTGLFGQHMWKFELVSGFSSGVMFEVMMYAGSLGTSLPMSFWNIYKLVQITLFYAIHHYWLWIHTILHCSVELYVGSVYTVDHFLATVHAFRSYRDKSGKMLGFWEAMRPLIIPLVFFALGTAWVYQSGSDIINRDPRMFLFMIGTLFANVNVGIDWCLIKLIFSTLIASLVCQTLCTRKQNFLLILYLIKFSKSTKSGPDAAYTMHFDFRQLSHGGGQY